MIYDPSENKRIYSPPVEKLGVPLDGSTRAAYLLEYDLLLIVSEYHSIVIDTSGFNERNEWQEIKKCRHA